MLTSEKDSNDKCLRKPTGLLYNFCQLLQLSDTFPVSSCSKVHYGKVVLQLCVRELVARVCLHRVLAYVRSSHTKRRLGLDLCA